MSEKRCLNCDFPVAGHFCSTCGQRTDTTRLNVRRLWQDFLERVLLYDVVIRETAVGLFRHPEQVIGRYIAGERQKFVNPLKYLIAALLVEVFIDPLFDARLSGFLHGGKDEISDWRSIQIAAVFLAAFIWHSLNRSQKYNFAENAVFCIYVAAQSVFLHVFVGLAVLAVILPWIPVSLADRIEEMTQIGFWAGLLIYAAYRQYRDSLWKIAAKSCVAIGLSAGAVEVVLIGMKTLGGR